MKIIFQHTFFLLSFLLSFSFVNVLLFFNAQYFDCLSAHTYLENQNQNSRSISQQIKMISSKDQILLDVDPSHPVNYPSQHMRITPAKNSTFGIAAFENSCANVILPLNSFCISLFANIPRTSGNHGQIQSSMHCEQSGPCAHYCKIMIEFDNLTWL